MSPNKNRSFLGFTRTRKVRVSESEGNLSNLLIFGFFAVVVGGIFLGILQNNPLGLVIFAIVLLWVVFAITYRKPGYEDEIRDMVQDITNEPNSKVFIADTIFRYPKAIQILPGRVVLWSVKKGIPVKFLESSISQTTLLIVTKKRSFIPFLYYRGVTLLDNESKQSYTVVPFYRVLRNVLPDTDGELSSQIVESIKDSGYSDLSFDDI